MEIEYALANCDTCKVYLNGFLLGRYNFMENKFAEVRDEDWGFCAYDNLTERQKRLINEQACKWFLRIYNEEFERQKLTWGNTISLDSWNYYTKMIEKLKDNLKGA